MAKMGQPMLPLVGAVPAQGDSDEEAVVVSHSQSSTAPVIEEQICFSECVTLMRKQKGNII